MPVASLTSAVLMVVSLASHSADACEPISSPQFVHPGDGWLAIEYEMTESAGPWQFAVYIHSETGDLLSFATRPVQPPEGERELVFWSDTAREIFPVGHPVWATPSPSATSNTIRDGVVELKGIEALQYSLVIEVPDEDNRMVHGYAWMREDDVIFVQHTSLRPITSDLSQTMAATLIQQHRFGP